MQLRPIAGFLFVSIAALTLASPGRAEIVFPTGTYPKFVIAADLRNNGMQDVITANYLANTVSVLLNTGGSFAAKVDYPVSPYPTGLATADLNGDGILDIVVADAINPHATTCNDCGAQAISILFGNGDGTFQPAVYLPALTGTAWVSAVDVNGDGIPDIEAACWESNTVAVLLGNGDGTFQKAKEFRVQAVPHSLAVADFNGDGHMDIAAGNYYANTVTILLGDGTGDFTTSASYPVGEAPHAIASADFNGDGIVDLVTANMNSNTVSVLYGNGDGTFQAAVNLPVGPGPMNVVAGDLNGDGKPDIAAANTTESAAAGVDFDEFRPSSSSVPSTTSIILDVGNYTFDPQVAYDTGSLSNGLAIADFNNDGIPDIAVEHFTAYVSIMWGTGDGHFAAFPPKTSTKHISIK
jgi:hypothetical protein